MELYECVCVLYGVFGILVSYLVASCPVGILVISSDFNVYVIYI